MLPLLLDDIDESDDDVLVLLPVYSLSLVYSNYSSDSSLDDSVTSYYTICFALAITKHFSYVKSHLYSSLTVLVPDRTMQSSNGSI